MKIAFIGQKGIPARFGGVETHTEELSTRLAKKGHEVFVYARKNYTTEKIKNYQGVKIINLPTIPSKHLDAITHTFLASIHAIFGNYDIIHYHSIGPGFLSFIPRVLLKKTKIVGTYHCQDYYHKKWNALARFSLRLGEWMICHAPHSTITVSKNLKSLIKNKFKKDAVYIPNGANIKKTENFNQLKKWGLNKNDYLLSVSRLVRHKGIHYLIEAFLELKRKKLNQGKKLVIVGDGFHTDDYVAYLKDLAKSDSDIKFTGNQTGENLKQLFSHAYAFIQPSETEGLSISLLEAMSCGKAVLVSDIPENMEAVLEAGCLFESSNVKDLEEKIQKMIDNPVMISEMENKSWKISQQKYDWEKIVADTEKTYQEILFA